MTEPTDRETGELIERRARPSVVRRVVGLLALALIVLALWVTTDREAVRAWRAEAGPIPFFIALTLLPAVGFPATPFFVLAGALYGVWIGLFGSALAIAGNLLLCYWLANSKLRPWLERLLSRSRFRLPNLAESRSHAFRFTLLVRIAPGLPTFAKNYAIGMTGVPFWIYFVLSFVLTGIYAAPFIVLGESIFDRDFDSVGVTVGVLVIGGGAALWFRSRRAKRLGGSMASPAAASADSGG